MRQVAPESPDDGSHSLDAARSIAPPGRSGNELACRQAVVVPRCLFLAGEVAVAATVCPGATARLGTQSIARLGDADLLAIHRDVAVAVAAKRTTRVEADSPSGAGEGAALPTHAIELPAAAGALGCAGALAVLADLIVTPVPAVHITVINVGAAAAPVRAGADTAIRAVRQLPAPAAPLLLAFAAPPRLHLLEGSGDATAERQSAEGA